MLLIESSMRRVLTAVLLFFSAAFCVVVKAYSPTTTWPYLYPEFVEGTVMFLKGGEKTAKFNIHLSDNQLHYIDGAYVKSVNVSDVAAAKIGDDIYASVSGSMFKVLAKSDKCLIVEGCEIDYASLNSTGGAYGSSSNTMGTMALTSAEGTGASNSSSALNHMELKRNKEDGKVLPLIIKKYFFVKGYKIFCAKKDVLDLPLDKDVIKTFIKERGIKFREPVSALVLGDFLYELL